MKNKKEVEKKYSKKQLNKILKRLIDSLSKEKAFKIQIKGNKVYVPKDSEIEIEIKWKK